MVALPKNKAVLVTDIGCIGIIDRYFEVNSFHGLHGRAITYASGIKLANPELTVIAVMGDGGAGIGGSHLLSAARRNLDITVIVANNFNYGMTGGQHSCTTPREAVTATTPFGNLETPLDLIKTLAALKPSFLARTHVFSEGQADIIARAIRAPGFALVDIWDFCIAYFGGRMTLNKKAMEQLMADLDMPAGVLHECTRTEFAQEYRQRSSSLGVRSFPKSLHQVAQSKLERRTGILIAGAAGQRIRTAATLIGASAIASGLKATQKDDYPITVRTGYSVSEVIISPEEIYYTGIDDPDIVLVLARDGLSHVARTLRSCSPKSRVYVDEHLANEIETPGQVIVLPFARTARKVNKLAIGAVAFGAVLARERLFPPEAFEAAVRQIQRKELWDTFVAAFRAGFELEAATG